MSRAYDPDAILRQWLTAQLAQRPDLTVAKLVQAAATHFNRPRWPRQNPATHRAWRLAQEVVNQTLAKQTCGSPIQEDTHADPD